jgi:ribulose-5-phosphate 4-epimerase/fuculose-1-phosphate aldolase
LRNTGDAALRDEVVDVCRVLVTEGLVTAFGHVSVRLPDAHAYLITPKKSLAFVQAGELIVTDVATGRVLQGEATPPLESLIHAAIYEARRDVGAIVRAQPRTVELFGVLGRPLRVVHQCGAIMLGDTPVLMTSDPIATPTTARQLAQSLGAAAGVVLRGNGVAVTGRTLVEAALRTIYIEDSARLQHAAMQIGEPIYYRPDEIERIGHEVLLPNQQARAWAYYLARATGAP